jgi:hypothetical protein
LTKTLAQSIEDFDEKLHGQIRVLVLGNESSLIYDEMRGSGEGELSEFDGVVEGEAQKDAAGLYVGRP